MSLFSCRINRAHSLRFHSFPAYCEQNHSISVSLKTGRSVARIFRKVMNDSPSRLISHRQHNTGLIIIAVYKLLQSLLFVAIGVGMLQLLHKDVGDLFAQLVDYLRFNPESRVINFILDEASRLNDPLLRRIGTAAFCYAGLDVIQAVGLYLEKVWAEYLTLIITASFLPWEIFEVLHGVTWGRCSLLLINFLIFLYLLKVLIRRCKCRCEVRCGQMDVQQCVQAEKSERNA